MKRERDILQFDLDLIVSTPICAHFKSENSNVYYIRPIDGDCSTVALAIMIDYGNRLFK